MTAESKFAGRVLVVIPTYNEQDNVVSITARVRVAVPGADLLIVDDNSPDGTGRTADELAAVDTHIHVLHRQAKAGLGAAYLAGFGWALEQGYDVVVEMDADGSHQPEELPRLLGALNDADLVLGSRWVPGGRVLNWPLSRQVLSRAGNTYARIVLGITLRDVTGGYRVYRANALHAISLADVRSEGYCFQVDLALRALQAGLAVTEVPITFIERARGTSKMSNTIIFEALWRVTQWAISQRLHPRHPRKPSGQAVRRVRTDSGVE
jgi:dolichol-phosphate mannosyltransferase